MLKKKIRALLDWMRYILTSLENLSPTRREALILSPLDLMLLQIRCPLAPLKKGGTNRGFKVPLLRGIVTASSFYKLLPALPSPLLSSLGLSLSLRRPRDEKYQNEGNTSIVITSMPNAT